MRVTRIYNNNTALCLACVLYIYTTAVYDIIRCIRSHVIRVFGTRQVHGPDNGRPAAHIRPRQS